MRTSVRTAAVTAMSLALLVTACGGEKKADEQGKGKATAPSAAATPTAPAAKVLTQGELEEAIVGQADLKGYKVEAGEGSRIGSSAVIVDKEACKPLADAVSAIPHHLAFATAETTAVELPKKDPAAEPGEALLKGLGARATTLALSSYEGDSAQEALSAVKASGTACAGGFTVTVMDEKTKVRSVAPASVSFGDESQAWTVTMVVEGAPHVTNVVLFRKGGTVALAVTNSLAPGGTATLPKAVLAAQEAKLG
ncbi:hypothetical protein [Streptomyces sp. NPDC093600]|uniref:hypothetical protein n=1 Tax=Streptomyces sp. NPDC093600 TaxID=3366047 RepID=UPI0038065C38